MKSLTTIKLAALLLISITLQACMSGMQMRTESADPKLVPGTYTLLLYGCHYPDQIDNVAILVDENSKYPLEIYDINTSYTTKKDIIAQQALTQADAFVRCSTHKLWQTRVAKILDDSGGTLGYEVRPLYMPLEFGVPDVMLISYSLKNGKVRAYIRLMPPVEDQGGDGRDTNDSGGHR
jgi:hypothetical protein